MLSQPYISNPQGNQEICSKKRSKIPFPSVAEQLAYLCHTDAKSIAAGHYPPGRGSVPDHTPEHISLGLIAEWSIRLCSSNGHMRNFANMPIVSISDVLYHKTEAIRLVNQRMAEASKTLTDETLAAVCILVTVQKSLGECDEMKIHLRGLLQMVRIRGGLESLEGGHMRGLLIGEILW